MFSFPISIYLLASYTSSSAFKLPSPLSLCSISFDNVVCANCSLTNCSLIRMAEAQHEVVLSLCNPLLSKKPKNTNKYKILICFENTLWQSRSSCPFPLLQVHFFSARLTSITVDLGFLCCQGLLASSPAQVQQLFGTLLIKPSNFCFFLIKTTRAAP